MNVSENLLRRQTEATKVAATEREKKKTRDVAPLVVLEKKTVSKRKNPSLGEKDKEIVTESSQREAAKPQVKKQKVEKAFEGEEDADASATPHIQPSTFYPPRAREAEEPKDPPIEIVVDPVEAAATEAHSEQARLYFSSTYPPSERLKQTPEEEARGKKLWEDYEKTGEYLVTGPVPTTHMARLMDVIDKDEELNYIDDETPAEASKEKSPYLKTIEATIESAIGKGESSGLKPRDQIDLDYSEAEKPAADQSRSPPTAEGRRRVGYGNL
jgi:hypothetical protein